MNDISSFAKKIDAIKDDIEKEKVVIENSIKNIHI